jgi:hypothetical protein
MKYLFDCLEKYLDNNPQEDQKKILESSLELRRLLLVAKGEDSSVSMIEIDNLVSRCFFSSIAKDFDVIISPIRSPYTPSKESLSQSVDYYMRIASDDPQQIGEEYSRDYFACQILGGNSADLKGNMFNLLSALKTQLAASGPLVSFAESGNSMLNSIVNLAKQYHA